MSLKDEIEHDVRSFFDQIEKQNLSDKYETLRNLLNKYSHLSTSEYLIDKYDLQSIISHAKSNFTQKTFPVYLGDDENLSKVAQEDQANLCVIESAISHLNNKECFSKLPKFKYNKK